MAAGHCGELDADVAVLIPGGVWREGEERVRLMLFEETSCLCGCVA
jgi:hypothetical protein